MKPLAKQNIKNFYDKILNKETFCFVRFSDGEVEIIRNRYLKISKGITYFRGKKSKNNFSQLDSKEFDPNINFDIREDLILSSIARMRNFYKGMPHKRSIKDRDLLVTLNGGLDENITFADLLINSNYKFFREKIVPLICNYKNVYLIANFRAKPINILKKSKHIKIPDNFFDNYQQIRDEVIDKLLNIPKGSLILSSASSLSNIVGYRIFQLRKDITFLDVGTSINDLLSLDKITRSYHVTYFSKGLKPFLRKLRPSFYIRW
tara:strand:- start:171 stop:959 length:789 start_codon:yes stop_codon:yes gene_type:complete